MDPGREVLGFIVNIRFKICRPVMIGAGFGVFCVTSAERLGNGTEYAAAERPLARTDAAMIAAKRTGAPGGPVSPEDREWLHPRIFPQRCAKTQS